MQLLLAPHWAILNILGYGVVGLVLFAPWRWALLRRFLIWTFRPKATHRFSIRQPIDMGKGLEHTVGLGPRGYKGWGGKPVHSMR